MRVSLSLSWFTSFYGGDGDGDDDVTHAYTYILYSKEYNISHHDERKALTHTHTHTYIHTYKFLAYNMQTIKMNEHLQNRLGEQMLCMFDFSCCSSLKLGIVILQCHVWWQERRCKKSSKLSLSNHVPIKMSVYLYNVHVLFLFFSISSLCMYIFWKLPSAQKKKIVVGVDENRTKKAEKKQQQQPKE